MASLSSEPDSIDEFIRICRLYVDQGVAITAIGLPACFALRGRDRGVDLEFTRQNAAVATGGPSMLAEDLILVTGATGNTGSTLLQQLEARGGRLRAMVRGQPDGALRDTSATIVVGNFDD